MRRSLALAAGGLVAAGSVTAVQGAVVYSTAGSTYSQDFNSLPTSPEGATLGNSPIGWTDDNASPGAGNFSIVGWYLYHPTDQSSGEGGFNGHQRMRISTGSSSTGAYYSYGSSASTERALGDVGANTLAANGAFMFYALKLTNTTGQTLDNFTLGFTGEQWRSGASAVNDPITVGYSLSSSSATFQTDTFTNISGLTFNSLNQSGTAATLDGNASGNRTVFTPVNVTGISWASGTDLFIRWDSLQNSATDQGMAIDDLSFSATPEPASLSVVGLGVVGLIRRPRPRTR